jgi:AraC-like DNA-binding protein
VSAPQKLSDADIRRIRDHMAKRHALQQQLALLPTLEQMADELSVSSRYLREIVHGRARQA